MNIHEFQAKQLFAQFGVPVPKGKEIKTHRAAEKWAAALDASVFVVKAQIHAGGRGKAGGVKLTKNKEEVAALAKELLGKTLVTHQTGPNGKKVRRLLIEEGAGIAKELYLGEFLIGYYGLREKSGKNGSRPCQVNKPRKPDPGPPGTVQGRSQKTRGFRANPIPHAPTGVYENSNVVCSRNPIDCNLRVLPVV